MRPMREPRITVGQTAFARTPAGPYSNASGPIRRLASSSDDGTVRVWALEVDELVEVAERGLTRGLTRDECRQHLHAERCPRP